MSEYPEMMPSPSLFESLDRITFPKRAEQWSFRVGALTGAGGRVAAGAIPVHKSLAAPDCGRPERLQPTR
jgi:hypothetical protein